jgi:hypothetical protein
MERRQVTLVKESVNGRRILRILWQDHGHLRSRTLSDTPENWAVATALVSALAEGREADSCLSAQGRQRPEVSPVEPKVRVTVSGGALGREDFRMTEEQWIGMKTRLKEAAQRHLENVEVLDARYKRALFSLALQLAMQSQAE